MIDVAQPLDVPRVSSENITNLPSPAIDEGLTCLKCEYSLAGLTGQRCPECGVQIDWEETRTIHERERRRRGTYWERWPWYLKPLGFVATAIQMACVPWVFAKQLPARPRIKWALVFAAICLSGIATGNLHNRRNKPVGNVGLQRASNRLYPFDCERLTLARTTVACHASFSVLARGRMLCERSGPGGIVPRSPLLHPVSNLHRLAFRY